MIKDLTIRPAVTEDIHPLVALMTDARAAQIEAGFPPAWSTIRTRRITDDVAAKRSYVLEEQNGRLIGAVSIHDQDPEVWSDNQVKALYVHRLAILPNAQKRGLGSYLIRWCEQEAVNRGRNLLRLDAVTESSQLRDWYMRLGFQAVGNVTPSSYGRPSTLFEKSLGRQ